MNQQLGHFELIEKLGRGGMGTVYKAHEMSLNRTVAIKVLAEHLSEDANHIARFKREAQSAAALNHPNIVQIYFIGEDQDKHFFSMEYVKGESVKDLLKREGKLDVTRALKITRDAASGLAAAHDEGLVHRDIKPGNIMISEKNVVKVADFGLAYNPEAHAKLTATGMFMGTPGYVAPEQCTGEPVGPGVDIYALGITLYEMLAGRSAFETESLSPVALIHQIIHEDPPDLRELRPDIGESTASLIRHMIAKKPDQRIPSFHDVVQEIDRILAADPTRAVAAAAPPPVPDPAQAETVRSAVTPPSPPAPAPPPVMPPQPPHHPNRPSAPKTGWIAASLGALLLIAAAVTGFLLWNPSTPSGQRHQEEPGDTIAHQTLQHPDQTAQSSVFQTPPASEDAPSETSTTPENVSSEPLLATVTGAFDAPDTTQNSFANESRDPQVSQATLDTSGNVHDPAAIQVRDSSSSAGGYNETPSPDSASTRRSTAKAHSPVQAAAALQQPNPATTSHEGSQHQTAAVTQDQPYPGTVEPSRFEPMGESESVPAMEPPHGVAVVVLGDPLMAEPMEIALENNLSQSGFEISDERLDSELNAHLRQDPAQVNVPSLIQTFAQSPTRFLVLVNVDYLGERELKYMGRYERAFQARVSISCYEPHRSKNLGERWQEQIEYTHVSAHRVAEKTAHQFGHKIAETLKRTP